LKANFFQTMSIMVRSGFLMVKVCVLVVIKGILGRYDRKKIDDYVRKWAKQILQTVRMKIKIENPYHVDFSDNKRYIIMCNHSSLYDIPLAFVALPGSIRMIAKKELFRIPLFGSALRHSEIISIDRQDRRQAVKDLQLAESKMDTGLILWMAPEGTRSRDGKLGPLKKGGFVMAIRSGAMIVPLGIRGAREILPAKTWNFHLNQEVECHVGKPIDASAYTLDNKEALIDLVKTQLEILANISSREV
jgi:1-acyl-sn-glycerol-3-phosphate acyltransferase